MAKKSPWSQYPSPRYPVVEVIWADPQKQSQIDAEGAVASELYVWRTVGRLVKKRTKDQFGRWVMVLSQDQAALNPSHGDTETIPLSLVLALRVIEAV